MDTKRKRFPLRDTLRQFLPLKEYFVHNRLVLALGLLTLLAVDFLQLMIPLVIKGAVDALTTDRATALLLFRFALLIVAISIAMAGLRYVWRLLLFGISRKIEEGIRHRLYAHLQTLPPAFYQKTKTGDIMARAVNDINAVRMASGMGLVALTDGMVLGLAAIGFMVSINPLLTAISLIPAPLIILFTRVLTRRMSSGYERVQRTFSELTEVVREAFAGIRVVKAFSRETWQYRKLEDAGQRYIRENLHLARTLGLLFPLMLIFTNLGLAVVIVFGGRLTILGGISTGDFVAFISYLNLLAWPMMALGWVTNLIQRGAASMRRINALLDEKPGIQDAPGLQGAIRLRGGITFRGQRLTYPGQGSFALDGITLDVHPGQTVAFVGRVGSGKTSLLHTLSRLYDSPPGTLFFDGTEVHEIPLKTLRSSIGFATQEAFIFSDTIRNNVLFGRSGVPETALTSALQQAQILEEMLALVQGLDTPLGERGTTLSGGQRQRLAIARAILAGPPILILDDALSMVDTRTEERILNEILSSRKGKTTLFVSHRLSTISRADKIVVLAGGEVLEEGDHRSLLSRGGEYSRLYRRQLLAKELEQ